MQKYCVLGTSESLEGLLKIGQITYSDDYLGDGEVIYFLQTNSLERDIKEIVGVKDVSESGIGECFI